MPGVQRIQLGSQLQKQNRQPTSKTAAWQKRPSDRQLLRQQLGRRELQSQTGNFSNSSLEEETFTKATSETAAWKKNFQHSSFKESSLEKALCLRSLEDSSLATQLGTAQLSDKNFENWAFRASEKNFYNWVFRAWANSFAPWACRAWETSFDNWACTAWDKQPWTE